MIDKYDDQRALLHEIGRAARRGEDVFVLLMGFCGPVRITDAYTSNNLATLIDGQESRTVVHLSAVLGVHMPLATEWTLGELLRIN